MPYCELEPLGGDQQFYCDLGFKVERINEIWNWRKNFNSM